jgi:hypothetical protein
MDPGENRAEISAISCAIDLKAHENGPDQNTNPTLIVAQRPRRAIVTGQAHGRPFCAPQAFCQPRLKRCLEGLRFPLGSAVYQPVVRIPTLWKVGVCPRLSEARASEVKYQFLVPLPYKSVKSGPQKAAASGAFCVRY